MEDLRTQQIEALEVAVPYCAKISNALNNLMEELNGHRQPDTDEYMKSTLNVTLFIFYYKQVILLYTKYKGLNNI